MKRIAFYGGSFDPVHGGHLTIARRLTEIFGLDEFVFIPAFHAPHKKDKKPTSAFHRYAMLCLATNDDWRIGVSRMEIEAPERPFTVETLTRLKNELPENTRIFFVMGADSWQDITTWREWEKVLTMTSVIVVTRPDYEIGFSHVTDAIRERIVDLRGNFNAKTQSGEDAKQKTEDRIPKTEDRIFITDAVQIDISATEIRRKIRDAAADRHEFLPPEVIKYVEKYGLYLK
ncbi:MAG: nicotinate-nucleotide adenylyltransferase [Acidobacteriota bacterium]|nr:nicotinate-nucleotide adenylyltransferase [Acidobacteriota bacterium]